MDPVARGVVQVERQAHGPAERPKGDDMNDNDDDFEFAARLAALDARAPGIAAPPAIAGWARRGRFAVSMTLAPVLVLALVATTAGAALVLSNLGRGYPGIQNPGQPLAGAHMECMSPPEAAAFLAERGFTNVDWQVETGAAVAPDGGKGITSTVHQSVAPAHGYVIPGSLLEDGQVIMVVDQRAGATGVGDCYGHPIP
jgi:hypothetical protein